MWAIVWATLISFLTVVGGLSPLRTWKDLWLNRQQRRLIYFPDKERDSDCVANTMAGLYLQVTSKLSADEATRAQVNSLSI